MTLEMKLEDVRRTSFQEGWKKGWEEGLKKSREEGQEETLTQVIKLLIEDEGWTFEKACSVITVPTEMRERIKENLK